MHRLLTTSMFTLLLFSAHILAGDRIYTSWSNNKAIGGYDTVAYFTKEKAIEGSSDFKTEHLGADWYFSSAEHLKLFRNNPEKYMPQYGGHCSWAMAVKKQRASGDPKAWKVVNNKLYLNYSKSVQQMWLLDIPGYIRSANKNWAEII